MEINNLQYESFNARYLSFEDVAATFIPNREFDELLSNNHSVLMGPRGCGKTTLLKMLYPQALHSWDHPSASQIIESIPFWAVYIPTDSQWSSQLEYLNRIFSENSEIPHLISNELVCINILVALCNSFKDLLVLSKDSDLFDKETELSKELINLWELEKPISPSLYSIVQSLNKRVYNINKLVKKWRYSLSVKKHINVPDYFFHDFLLPVSMGCYAFQEIFKEVNFINQKKFKWALCFDELEIAPEWLQKKIFGEYLRSTNQSLLFKITSTPLIDWEKIYGSGNVNIIPSKGNDYSIIRTWVYNFETKESWKIFCEKLFTDVLNKNLQVSLKPIDVFGEYEIMKALEVTEPKIFNPRNKIKKDFAKGSNSWILFVELAKKDKSFREYLKANGVNPDNPEYKYKEDEVLRKIKPIAVFRYFFIKKEQKLRTRKTIPFYFGLPYIYELADGNPRAAINLISAFSPKIRNDKPLITIRDQSNIICNFSHLRLDYFNNYPNALIELGKTTLSMGDLLNAIGTFFSKELIGKDFKPEPITCFKIDKHTPEKIIGLVYLALNLGAIQYLDPSEEISKENLFNKKFRLSYVLHPHFGLPKRVNKSISLTKIINQEVLNKKDEGYNDIDIFQNRFDF
ncbi:MAG: hypothetical protein ACK5KL_08590 [Dysgonomonas sp.]